MRLLKAILIRGNSFLYDSGSMNLTFRGELLPNSKGVYYGIRVVKLWN